MARYDAFISYSHADTAMAERISARLRSYRAPRAARLGRRLVVFRDVERLTTSPNLGQELHERIENTEHLVLLASPSAAASRYVGDEIAAFMQAKGESRVIVVLCAGELSTALPATLRARQIEPLYIDLRNADRNRFRLESLRLIAAVYGVDYSELRRQDDQERRQRSAMAIASSIAFALILASGYLISATPAEVWATVPQPVRFASTDRLMPVEDFAVNRDDPSVVVWRGYNARYARDLARAADGDARSEIREVLAATADPEHTVLVNSPAFEEKLSEDLDGLGGEDFWLSLKGSDEWATYAPPERAAPVILSGGPNEVEALALAKGLDQALAESLARAIREGDIHAVQILRRGEGDRALSVAVVTNTRDFQERVGELAPVHLYRRPSQAAWTVIGLPRESSLTRILDVLALDASGERALVVTDREGFFRTTDGGASWQTASFGEPRVRSGASLKTVLVGSEVYCLAVLNKEPGDDNNPLFRLAQRTWLERWRIGISGWLP